MILDLSHSVQINGEQIPSVNEVTDKTISPAHSMMELRNVLPCMIYAVTMAHKSKGPVLFSKLDIKDGYWWMVVPVARGWVQFCLHTSKSKPTGTYDLSPPHYKWDGQTVQLSLAVHQKWLIMLLQCLKANPWDCCQCTSWNHSWCQWKAPPSQHWIFMKM